MKPEPPNELDILLGDAWDITQYLVFKQGSPGWLKFVRLALRRQDVRKGLQGYTIYRLNSRGLRRVLREEKITDLALNKRRQLVYTEAAG